MKSFCLKSVLSLVLLFLTAGRIKAENEDERLIKEELVKYFQTVDSDEDHHLTMDELARWIRKIHNIVIDENVSAQWRNLDKEIVEEHTWVDYELARKETVTWESYKKRIYQDHLEDQKAMNNKRSKEEIENEFNQIVARFEKRWKLADEDGTGYLTKEEFKIYLHPEESKNETVLNAAAEDLRDDLDRNHDGVVSFDEYFDHIKSISNEDERQEPDFEQVGQVFLLKRDSSNRISLAQINKENFEVHLDKNKNGILDLDEIKTWMVSRKLYCCPKECPSKTVYDSPADA